MIDNIAFALGSLLVAIPVALLLWGAIKIDRYSDPEKRAELKASKLYKQHFKECEKLGVDPHKTYAFRCMISDDPEGNFKKLREAIIANKAEAMEKVIPLSKYQ